MPVVLERKDSSSAEIAGNICRRGPFSGADTAAILQIAKEIIEGARIYNYILPLTENAARRRGLLPTSLDESLVTGVKITTDTTPTETNELSPAAQLEHPVFQR